MTVHLGRVSISATAYKRQRGLVPAEVRVGLLFEECPFTYGGDMTLYLWRWLFAVGVTW